MTVAPLIALALAGCATDVGDAALGAPAETSAPAGSSASTPTTDAAALAQAQAWLDAASLPAGAVPARPEVARFSSYTGWVCSPVEKLVAFWAIPDTTVGEATQWFIENPTADLVSTAVGPASDDPAIQSATVGYIPAPGSQEGIVYTVEKIHDGVAVRAEIAALAEGAVCPTPPGGGVWGAPGQG
ncbi:hypothetical protein [Microbacterium fluvii]|nr:hypothetical protein [Microbacterium fluvii]MCU4673057.1 hypothetical protein [Microbacterium fluvii]